MANPIVLQDDFSGGMKKDFPQDNMPPGSVWELQDMLPQRRHPGAAHGEFRTVETRGGWNYRTESESGTVEALAYFNGAGGIEIMITGNTAYSSSLTSQTATNEGGVGSTASQHPVEFYDTSDEMLVILTNTPNPRRLPKGLGAIVDMVAIDSAPAAYYGDVWKQRFWLGNTVANPARIYYSAGGDVSSWDTVEDFIDTDAVIDGIAALRSVLLIFHPHKTARFRGSPPDIIQEEAFNISPFDQFSWTRTGTETIVIAAPEGLFITDGAATKDLTKASGMTTWWREEMQAAKDAGAAPVCPIGHANGWVVFNLKYSSTNHAFAVNVESGSWFRLTNSDFDVLFSAPGVAAAGLAGDEIWGGTDGRICSVYPDIFSTTQQDADGTEPTPLLETPFYTGKGNIETPARALYFTYNLEGATAISGAYKTNPRQAHDAYTLPSTLGVTTAAHELERVRVRIAQRDRMANGVAVQLTKAASAGNFALGSVEAELKAREGSRIHYA